MQFHIVSFEGPDAYSRAGGLATRVEGLAETLATLGFETMAAGGIACTGCSGEDYAVPGRNALVLETSDPNEFLSMFGRLRTHPREAQALRRAGQRTAKQFAWPEIVQRVLVPRVELTYGADSPTSAASRSVLRADSNGMMVEIGARASVPCAVPTAIREVHR